jgi:hypothetical protein
LSNGCAPFARNSGLKSQEQEHFMAAKEQKRGNRELKKPKKKPVPAVPAPTVLARTVAAPVRIPKKS